MKAQFATRHGWLMCHECGGRSFSDPTKEFHYPGCAKYKAWRFGEKREYPDWEQDRDAASLRSRSHHSCTCDERPGLCEKCAEYADFDDGEATT